MQSWLSHFPAHISGITLIVATLVPIALAIFSRRLTVVLGALVLALASVCILLAPANAAEIVAIGFYFASLIIAVSGIVARKTAKALQTEIDRLRQDVNSLSIAAGRRFAKELNKERERITGDVSPRTHASKPGRTAAKEPKLLSEDEAQPAAANIAKP
jgi:hypothetical protein